MGILYSTCSTQSMRREEERQRQQVEVEGVEEEERREATRELIRKTEKLEIFLQQRPSAATYREEHHTTQCYRRRGSNLAGKESSRYRSSFCFPFPETSLSYVSLSLSLFLHQFCFVRRCLIERLLIAEQ